MYRVCLKSCGNIDFDENPFQEISPLRVVEANSIDECITIVWDYIEEYNLGGGNWIGGQVYDDVNNYLGKISYNGRFWDKDHPYGKEN